MTEDRDTSFIVKPPRGWLHADSLIANEGVSYTVRYIGSLKVLTSMKKLDFETRSQVAKECINRVCEASGLKSADKKRRVDVKVLRSLAHKPDLKHTGTNVKLSVSSKALTVTSLQGGDIIARHEMPTISFASGGDAETLDFVAYVGKNAEDNRACFVLECGRAAHEVISTIGQAFESRFKEFLTKPTSLNLNGIAPIIKPRTDEHEYYNDMPDKLPPESGIRPPNLPLHEERTYVNQTPPPRTPPTALLPPPAIDMFDMTPFTGGGGTECQLIPEPCTSYCAAKTNNCSQADLLAKEEWYHGPISRAIAEQRVNDDGDFLVRESVGCAGQFVLTGVRKGQRKHLLLIDPNGVVRTKDRIFSSVAHLICYHCENALPIVSADSALLLQRPIPRPL